mgnify:CR=1 FL=1
MRRLLVGLCGALGLALIAVPPVTADSPVLPLGDPTLVETRESTVLAEGVTLTRIVRGRKYAREREIQTTTRGPWRVNVLEIDPALATGTLRSTHGYDLAHSLDQQMIARGPVHGSGRAYANIVAKPDYSGRLVQEQTCRLEDFTVSAEFTMTLPQLGGGAKLSPDLAARWESFQDFVRRHEEGHRDIWIETMQKAESRISALRAPASTAMLQMVMRFAMLNLRMALPRYSKT